MKGLIRIFENTEFVDLLEIKNNNFHYLKNVRRVTSDSLIVIMSYNQIAKYQIIEINKKSILLKLIKHSDIIKPKYELTLYQAILKREYMDNVVEKAGEIGVTKFVPVITSRSIGQIKENTLKRYKDLLISGTMQAEHNFIPEFLNPIKLNEIKPQDTDFYVFYERNGKKQIPQINSNKISLFIGAEGGITDEELEILKLKGAEIISPTNSILKSESASLIFTGMVKIFMENKFGI
jgi:16S rRNA (uracil1498-N3)-methyltransferase